MITHKEAELLRSILQPLAVDANITPVLILENEATETRQLKTEELVEFFRKRGDTVLAEMASKNHGNAFQAVVVHPGGDFTYHVFSKK